MPASFGRGLQHMDRKSKKPLMEKRRRARINKCLHDLKALLLETLKRDPAHTSKLEKADILEMTVLMLKDQQRRQLTTAVSIDSSVFDRYLGGWAECYAQIMHYANNVEGFNPQIRERMLRHLESAYRTLMANKQLVSGAMPLGVPGATLPPLAKLFPPSSNPSMRRAPVNPWSYLSGTAAATCQQPSVVPLRNYDEIIGLISVMERQQRESMSSPNPNDNEVNTSKSESENSGQTGDRFGNYDDVTDPGSDSSESAEPEDNRSHTSSVEIRNPDPPPASTGASTQIRKDTVWRPW